LLRCWFHDLEKLYVYVCQIMENFKFSLEISNKKFFGRFFQLSMCWIRTNNNEVFNNDILQEWNHFYKHLTCSYYFLLNNNQMITYVAFFYSLLLNLYMDFILTRWFFTKMGSKGDKKSITKPPNDNNNKPNTAIMFIMIFLVKILIFKTTSTTLICFPWR
jgi:hypothetical protein